MVNQTGLPDESMHSQKWVDDIPAAQRDDELEAPAAEVLPGWHAWQGWQAWRPGRWGRRLAWGLLGVVMALGLGGLAAWMMPRPAPPLAVVAPSGLSADPQLLLKTGMTAPPDALPGSSTLEDRSTPDELLGHFPYAEAPSEALTAVSSDRSILLRTAAAQRFMALAQAAATDDIPIIPLSGFRTLDDQTVLFFERKAEQGQRAIERAAVSAPPGYSEHHTGYAVDIGDRAQPETHLEVSFENTRTFVWMQANAARFGYELSFPRDNPQGVSYEPWHWRFVGDRHSLETFYKSRQVRPVSLPSPRPKP